MINVDTTQCVGRSKVVYGEGSCLSSLFPEPKIINAEPYCWKQMQDELEKILTGKLLCSLKDRTG